MSFWLRLSGQPARQSTTGGGSPGLGASPNTMALSTADIASVYSGSDPESLAPWPISGSDRASSMGTLSLVSRDVSMDVD